MLHRPPPDASPEDLLICLRLWPRISDNLRAECTLLPRQCPPPPATTFTTGAEPARLAAAAASIFSPSYLQLLAPALLDTTHAHPRMHTLWTHLLALLLPGFTVAKSHAVDQDGLGPSTSSGEPGVNGSKKHDKKQHAGVNGAKEGKHKGGSAVGEKSKGQGGSVHAIPKGHPNQAHLEALWSITVEGSLMNSSHERKFLALQLFMVSGAALFGASRTINLEHILEWLVLINLPRVCLCVCFGTPKSYQFLSDFESYIYAHDCCQMNCPA